MYTKTAMWVLLSILLFWALLWTRFDASVAASVALDQPVHNINTGLHYTTIQEAIDAPETSDGHTILVDAGQPYHEQIILSKSIRIVGENPNTTIIDGDGNGFVVSIIKPNSEIQGFTIRNAGSTPGSYNIRLGTQSNITVCNNVITNSWYGIWLLSSNSSHIANNTIIDNYAYGISFEESSNNNDAIGNLITKNPTGIYIHGSSKNNTFYHNNFINNTDSVFMGVGASAKWDNGAEGNYWSNYNGTDFCSGPYQNETGSDGIGDTPYPDPLSGWDKYPLIEPWSLIRFFEVPLGEDVYYVRTYCDSTVASFNFTEAPKQISFNITGPKDTTGFCNVTIPRLLLNATPPDEWQVLREDIDITATVKVFENATHTSVYFTYLHSTHRVRIRVAEVENQRPLASFTYSPTDPMIGQNVTFTDESTDPDGSIILRIWDFGDGTPFVHGTGSIILHSYAAFGAYNVTLTVVDNATVEPAMNQTSQVVTVRKIGTNLTILVSQKVIVGENVTIVATLRGENGDPILNATVEFLINQTETWESIGSAETNSSGVASVFYTPTMAGKFLLKAMFNETEVYLESDKIVMLEVGSPSPDYTLYLIAGLIIAAISVAIAFIKLKKSKIGEQKTADVN